MANRRSGVPSAEGRWSPASDPTKLYDQGQTVGLPSDGDCAMSASDHCRRQVLPTLCPRKVSRSGEQLVETGRRGCVSR